MGSGGRVDALRSTSPPWTSPCSRALRSSTAGRWVARPPWRAVPPGPAWRVPGKEGGALAANAARTPLDVLSLSQARVRPPPEPCRAAARACVPRSQGTAMQWLASRTRWGVCEAVVRMRTGLGAKARRFVGLRASTPAVLAPLLWSGASLDFFFDGPAPVLPTRHGSQTHFWLRRSQRTVSCHLFVSSSAARPSPRPPLPPAPCFSAQRFLFGVASGARGAGCDPRDPCAQAYDADLARHRDSARDENGPHAQRPVPPLAGERLRSATLACMTIQASGAQGKPPTCSTRSAKLVFKNEASLFTPRLRTWRARAPALGLACGALR